MYLWVTRAHLAPAWAPLCLWAALGGRLRIQTGGHPPWAFWDLRADERWIKIDIEQEGAELTTLYDPFILIECYVANVHFSMQLHALIRLISYDSSPLVALPYKISYRSDLSKNCHMLLGRSTEMSAVLFSSYNWSWFHGALSLRDYGLIHGAWSPADNEGFWTLSY
jgi:hypothetical protein